MTYEEVGDSIKGYLQPSSSESPEKVTQTFTVSDSGPAFVVIQFLPKNLEKKSVLVV